MIWARPVSADVPADLHLALGRMGLPASAQEYLVGKVLHRHLLLTGIGRPEGGLLKSLADRSLARGWEEFPAYVPGDVRRRPGTALLSGRRDQFDRLVTLLQGTSEGGP